MSLLMILIVGRFAPEMRHVRHGRHLPAPGEGTNVVQPTGRKPELPGGDVSRSLEVGGK